MRIGCPLLLAPALLAGCGEAEVPDHLRIAGADAGRGPEAIVRYGCGTCHRIPGVRGARGLIGPPLDAFGQRSLAARPRRLSPRPAWS